MNEEEKLLQELEKRICKNPFHQGVIVRKDGTCWVRDCKQKGQKGCVAK